MDSVRRQAEALFQRVLDEPADRQDAFLAEQADVAATVPGSPAQPSRTLAVLIGAAM